MARKRIYAGLVRGGIWYNHAEIEPLKGGVLAMLDGADKTGAARLLNLLKNSVFELYSEDGEKLTLQNSDYLDIKIVDAWKMTYEQIKLKEGTEHPIIPENFYCRRCSRTGYENYTAVNESWQKLVDEGKIDEIFLDEPKDSYVVELPEAIAIEPMKTIAGGSFDTLVMKYLTVGDMVKIQNNPDSFATEASIIYATWDEQIIDIPGLSQKDFNILKRVPDSFFSKKYIVSDANQAAVIQAEEENVLGIIAKDRSIMCQNCGFEIGGFLDQTNFFSPFLPKK